MNFDTLPEPVPRLIRKYAAHPLPLAQSGNGDPAASELLTVPSIDLFPGAPHPTAALAGLLLLVQSWDGAHHVAQDDPSSEGSYWHAILHRIEPDSANAAYWFRRVGRHAIFSELHRRAGAILASHSALSWRLGPVWDPFLFIEWCDKARRKPGSPEESVARAIQQVEWELLFAFCAGLSSAESSI